MSHNKGQLYHTILHEDCLQDEKTLEKEGYKPDITQHHGTKSEKTHEVTRHDSTHVNGVENKGQIYHTILHDDCLQDEKTHMKGRIQTRHHATPRKKVREYTEVTRRDNTHVGG